MSCFVKTNKYINFNRLGIKLLVLNNNNNKTLDIGINNAIYVQDKYLDILIIVLL